MTNLSELETTRRKASVVPPEDRLPWIVASILCFGDWDIVRDERGERRESNRQYNAFEFSFRGPIVRWVGTQQSNHGYADVYIDGEFQQTVDNYAAVPQYDVVKFEKTGLSEDRIHTLRVVVRKDRHPDASDCYQDVGAVQVLTAISYPIEIAHKMTREYAEMRYGLKPYTTPDSWTLVTRRAVAPERGVTLGVGVLKDVFDKNIAYLNHCFSRPTYCDPVDGRHDWSAWLPAANDGRLLAGAGNTLRWGERADMRAIVDTVVGSIESHMRDDGYYNYYPESDSYTLSYGINSERKNYDRVFWTRGLLAAGEAGNPDAHGLLRRMYDWFNDSPYLPEILFGGNATNGLPGGPLMYLSPVGTDQDLITTMRYYDQDYWIQELTNREPLCLSYYPGERPHCYDLLGFEAFIDEYRATGDPKYLDAVRGGWDIYRDNFKHIGGATAIMESVEVYPPKSYYLTGKTMGETCGSVFWINVNSKLLELFPTEEKYAAEIEEAIFNIIAAVQDNRGYIRYHNWLHGTKAKPDCQGTCCEVSSSGLMGRLPEFIYAISDDGLYVNLFAASEIDWEHAGRAVRLTMDSNFPSDPNVSLRVVVPEPMRLILHIRIPSWANEEMEVRVNGSAVGTGTPGSYLALDRTWADGDVVDFTLPIGFTAVKYEGLDQIEGNLDRYALLYGPILMALTHDSDDASEVPRLDVNAKDLPSLLLPVEGAPLEYHLNGYPGYRYVPYWTINTETFTCFPVVTA